MKGERAPSAPGPAAWVVQALLGSLRLLPRAVTEQHRGGFDPHQDRPAPRAGGAAHLPGPVRIAASLLRLGLFFLLVRETWW